VFTIGLSQHAPDGSKKVQGYVLVQGILQWPHLNTNAETFADVLVYKAMALLDTFPIGDPEVLISFLEALYPEMAASATFMAVFFLPMSPSTRMRSDEGFKSFDLLMLRELATTR
jgi:hypothetical protein